MAIFLDNHKKKKCLVAMEEVESKVQFEFKDFETPPPDLGDLEVKIHYSLDLILYSDSHMRLNEILIENVY